MSEQSIDVDDTDAGHAKELERVLARYYSHRKDDILHVMKAFQDAIKAGEIRKNQHPLDLVNEHLFGVRGDAYLTVRALALEILRNPRRIGTTSTGETLAMALLFDRKDWLGDDTWAYAAKRVGVEWLNAIVQIEQDFHWMRPPIKVKKEKR